MGGHASAHRRARCADPDELWFVEHPPVYTLGLNADPSHVLDAREIPVVKTDRGGQVTYHGPAAGGLSPVRSGALADERAPDDRVPGGAVVDTLAGYGIEAVARRDAPGVYVSGRKLAAVGLRVRRHCSYHGIAVNIDMDLEPFRRINPCGSEGLEVTQLSDLCGGADVPVRACRTVLGAAGAAGPDRLSGSGRRRPPFALREPGTVRPGSAFVAYLAGFC